MQPEYLILQMPGHAVNALVKRSAKRRRTLSVRVARDGQVHFNIPLRTSHKALREFAVSKQGWLFAQLQRAQARAALRDRAQNSMAFLGRDYPLIIEASPLLRRGGFCQLTETACVVHIPAGLPIEKQGAHIRQLLVKFYQAEAAQIFKARIAHYAAQLQVKVGSVKMRDTKSRWGSCDKHGNLNLNWRVVMVPMALVDYLIVHELCHIVHFDHSPQFWRLVGTIMPDYKQRRAALKEYDAGCEVM